jgi:hypothetical protein
MRALALSGTALTPEAIDGLVLAHDIRAPANHRDLLPKGRILRPADWTVIAQAGVAALYVIRMDPDDVHEDDAARWLSRLVAGPGIDVHGPVESQMRLAAATNGIFEVDVARLDRLNAIPDLSIFTLFDGQLVPAGKTVAGVKVTPFCVSAARLKSAEAVCAGGPPLLQVLSFQPMKVAVLVRERLSPALREKFETAIRAKVSWFGSQISDIRYVSDDAAQVADVLAALTQEADLLLTAGANATDPLDPTLSALHRLGAKMEKQGAPAHPGSAVWLAYVNDRPVFGVAACGMFSKATVLDLILPRLFTGARVRAKDFIALGHGGLLSKEMRFRFPPYDEAAMLDE